MADLAVIVVSTNEANWLSACLASVFEHSGDIELDVVVADNASTDGTRDLVKRSFPAARVVGCENHGFGHANNRAFETTSAPYVLFLNPDTEVLEGTFADLVAELVARPSVGVLGVRQVTPDGELFPTIRRFPSVRRTLFEALTTERIPIRSASLRERELDLAAYERETPCDWVSGSFMLIRRSALTSAGLFDERFFVYAEEVDLCLRIKQAGWDVVHVPTMTILHHADKAAFSVRVSSQDAFAKKQYIRKHFGPAARPAALGALALRFGIRAVAPGRDREVGQARRVAARAALSTLVGHRQPPFGVPPPQALYPRD